MADQITHERQNYQEISLSDRREAVSAFVKAREEKHITFLEFGWVSGVSWDAVRSWAQGRREPTMGNLVAVAQTLGFELILRPILPEQPESQAAAPPPQKRKSRRKHPNPN